MNNRGQSIIGAMVGLAIAAMAMVVVMSVIQMSTRQQSQSNFTFQADQLRHNLKMTMNNLGAWASTVKASENSPPYTLGGGDFAVPGVGLSCFVGVGGDCTDSEFPVQAPIHVVRDSNGAVIFNDLINTGFTLQGTPCNTFNPAAGSGSDQCPWSIKITWSAICGATCTGTNAVPQISVIPSYNPSPGNDMRLQFNPANYSAIFKQGSDGVTCWIYFGGVLYDSCAGNVGIGTTTPEQRLHIGGGIAGSIQVDNNARIIYKDTGGTAHNWTIFGNDNINYIDAAANGVQFRTVAVTNTVKIDSSGNVGIGTTSPDSALHVSGGPTWTTSTWLKNFHVPNGQAMQLGDGANSFLIGETNNAPPGRLYMGPVTGNTAAATVNYSLVMDLNGNVGIGTTAPASKLDVSGGAVSLYGKDAFQGQDTWLRLNQNGAFSSGIHSPHNLNASGMTVGALYYDPGAGNLHVQGNVGIGTTNPGSKLDVNGNLNVNGNETVAGQVTATLFLYGSDERLKTNIRTIENPIDKILGLRGVRFNWKKDGSPDIGFVAQEVEKVVPELVKTSPQFEGLSDAKSVKYGNIIAIVVEALKQIFAQLSGLQETVTTLQQQNSLIAARLEKLERQCLDHPNAQNSNPSQGR